MQWHNNLLSTEWLSIHCLDLEMLVFVEGATPVNRAKNPPSRDKNPQQTGNISANVGKISLPQSRIKIHLDNNQGRKQTFI